MKYQKEDLAYFPFQVEYALNYYQGVDWQPAQYQHIVLGGLGGSGIAGRIVERYFYRTANVPVEVVSGYDLPGYVNDQSLVILSSYSGNTEETMSLLADAEQRGCAIMAITKGGELGKKAEAAGYPLFHAEPGFQPRMALGYSLTYLLLILGDLFNQSPYEPLRRVVMDFQDTEAFIEKARHFFNKLSDQVTEQKFIPLTDVYTQPVGLRFCQQMQENAKSEAFVHEIPEANHNVIESYYGDLNSVFFCLNSQISDRINVRFEFLKDLLRKNGNHVQDLELEGNDLYSLLQTVYILDWFALLVADAKNINSLDIPNIETLKQVLAERNQQ